MGERSPAFSFYAKDFMLGTVTLTLAERGAYISLLAYQWDHGSVPDGPESLGRICGCSGAQAKKLWTAVGKKFLRGVDGQWRNPRLEAERAKQLDRREMLAANGRKGADKRWQTG